MSYPMPNDPDSYAPPNPREAMVLSQLHPSGVLDEALLAAFRAVPREHFVPETKRGVCYADTEIEISPTRTLTTPTILGRLMEALALTDTDRVLDVGCASGYSTAILAQIVGEVVAFEADALLLESTRKTVPTTQPRAQIRYAASLGEVAGEFSAIILCGSCVKMPSEVLARLAPSGRAVCVERAAGQPMGQARLYVKNVRGIISSRPIFDAVASYLPAYKPDPGFVF